MASDDALDPVLLEQANFDVVRRGFDPTAVRAQLREAAEEFLEL